MGVMLLLCHSSHALMIEQVQVTSKVSSHNTTTRVRPLTFLVVSLLLLLLSSELLLVAVTLAGSLAGLSAALVALESVESLRSLFPVISTTGSTTALSGTLATSSGADFFFWLPVVGFGSSSSLEVADDFEPLE